MCLNPKLYQSCMHSTGGGVCVSQPLGLFSLLHDPPSCPHTCDSQTADGESGLLLASSCLVEFALFASIPVTKGTKGGLFIPSLGELRAGDGTPQMSIIKCCWGCVPFALCAGITTIQDIHRLRDTAPDPRDPEFSFPKRCASGSSVCVWQSRGEFSIPPSTPFRRVDQTLYSEAGSNLCLRLRKPERTSEQEYLLNVIQSSSPSSPQTSATRFVGLSCPSVYPPSLLSLLGWCVMPSEKKKRDKQMCECGSPVVGLPPSSFFFLQARAESFCGALVFLRRTTCHPSASRSLRQGGWTQCW